MKLTRNWKAKLVSLLVSSLLFWLVHSTRNVTRTLQVRVEGPELSKNLVLNAKLPTFMNVELNGSSELMDFPISDFRIVLSNPRPEAGENIYRARLVPEPPVGVTAAYKTDIYVQLDRLLVRNLPVIPDIKFGLEPGYKPGYMRVEPPVIKIQGPYGVVSRMDRIATQQIEITGADSTFARRVLIHDLPEYVRLAPRQPLEVEFFMRLISTNPANTAPVGEVLELKQVRVHCANTIRGLDMKTLGSESVSIYLAVGNNKRVVAEQFRALVFCPVFFDGESKSIRPAFSVKDLLVRAVDVMGRENMEVLRVTPPLVSLQFERKQPKRQLPRRVQSNRQEGFRDFFLP